MTTRSRRVSPTLPAALLASGFLCNASAGVEPPAGAPPLPPAPLKEHTYEGLGWLPFPLQLELRGTGEFLDDSDAGPSGTVWRVGARLPFLIPCGDRVTFNGALSGRYSDYEDSPFGDDFQAWNFGALAWADVKVTDTWSVIGGGLGSVAFESGAERGDSWNGGGLAGIGYTLSDSFKIALGAAVVTRTDDNEAVVPVVLLDWRISDDFFIRVLGLEGRAEYRLSDEWSVFAGAEYDPGAGTLKPRRGVEATSFRDDAIRAGAGVTWRFHKAASLTVGGGVAFHELQLRDERENELAKDHVDPAPYVSVKLTARF